MPLGENHHNSKISNKDADWIRDNHKSRCPKYGSTALGKKFGVHRTTIDNILSGRTRSFTYVDLEDDHVKDLDGLKKSIKGKRGVYRESNHEKRPQRGDTHHRALIPREDIPSILEEYVAGCKEHGAAAIARRYGVTRQCIGLIIRKNR